MADITQEQVKQAVKEAVSETFPEGRMKALEILTEKISKVLLDPDSGLVIKVDRNSNDIAGIKKREEVRSNREWGIWAALIVSIGVSVLQLVR